MPILVYALTLQGEERINCNFCSKVISEPPSWASKRNAEGVAFIQEAVRQAFSLDRVPCSECTRTGELGAQGQKVLKYIEKIKRMS